MTESDGRVAGLAALTAERLGHVSDAQAAAMSDAKLRMVKAVLHWVWDPIGIRGIDEAVDEYDSYAQPLLELLEQGSPSEQVAAYLAEIESERMELTPHRDRNDDVAALLRELHALIV